MPATDKPMLLTKREVEEWLRDFSQPADSTMQERQQPRNASKGVV